MNNLKAVALAGAALLALTGAAQATVTDNAALAAPGVYFGSGNANTNFTVDTENGIEVGLSAITRYIGPIVPTGNVYDAATGPTTVSGKTGAAWGVDFSVNLNGGGGSLNLSDISTVFTLDDVGTGAVSSFDVLGIPDNTEYGSGGACTPAITCGPAANFYAFQNSESLSFLFVPGGFTDPLYDMNANDTYVLTLAVDSNVTGLSSLLATDSIVVNAGTGAAVPEPLTLSLFGAGLCGMAALRRRKAKTA